MEIMYVFTLPEHLEPQANNIVAGAIAMIAGNWSCIEGHLSTGDAKGDQKEHLTVGWHDNGATVTGSRTARFFREGEVKRVASHQFFISGQGEGSHKYGREALEALRDCLRDGANCDVRVKGSPLEFGQGPRACIRIEWYKGKTPRRFIVSRDPAVLEDQTDTWFIVEYARQQGLLEGQTDPPARP